jgi:hypothetical protein
VAHELDVMVEGVQLCECLRPPGELVEGEERAREQEERRDDGADDVVEDLDRLRVARNRDPEAGASEACVQPMNGTSSIPQAGSRPKKMATIMRTQP